MCQLTFSHLRSHELNQRYLYIQTWINTIEKHRDGLGYFYPTADIQKTLHNPQTLIDLGSFFQRFKGRSPLFKRTGKKGDFVSTFQNLISDKGKTCRKHIINRSLLLT